MTDVIGSCGVCGRQHGNVGYSPNDRTKPIWVCLDCVPIAKEVFHMPDAVFSRFERRALEQAGEIAGGYLDSIGRTDLATLTEDEWREFLQRVVHGFAENIRANVEVGDRGVPF